LELTRLGLAMKRAQLRRDHPEASEGELDLQLADWIANRPPDAPGRVGSWPRPE